MKAFILAAGLGTRLRPLTDNKPKALVEINGRTLLEITIERLMKAGFDRMIVNVHHFADLVIEYLQSKNNFGIEIAISDERNLLLDTGGALKKAGWFFSDGNPFLVHNVDILSDIDLAQFYQAHTSGNAIATLAVQKRESPRSFLFDEEKNLCGWQNSKTGEIKIARLAAGKLEPFAFSGIQVLDTEILDLLPEEKVFSLVGAYLGIASQKRITYFNHSRTLLIDLGKKENLIRAEEILK